ncbi:hypothetical protein A3H55_02655 [Candidatus Kuenenbacteria bacterium RIFCSPLOWO2_02_FULL_42_16]|uniref:Uncharacterized protein n=1 Tax=Candidatus Kuenenbacteria bacterium RIFCSPLOWO2_02_FULL_42_16 TaxID=1798564 RepID=A0A1F6G0N3_9BACT|nr:MAG: hypothetical protein A3H55_02655 [Candidatus Kuenenbacteria bacterium RIFCSPLOWO2_02_FULL_42_16]
MRLYYNYKSASKWGAFYFFVIKMLSLICSQKGEKSALVFLAGSVKLKTSFPLTRFRKCL